MGVQIIKVSAFSITWGAYMNRKNGGIRMENRENHSEYIAGRLRADNKLSVRQIVTKKKRKCIHIQYS